MTATDRQTVTGTITQRRSYDWGYSYEIAPNRWVTSSKLDSLNSPIGTVVSVTARWEPGMRSPERLYAKRPTVEVVQHSEATSAATRRAELLAILEDALLVHTGEVRSRLCPKCHGTGLIRVNISDTLDYSDYRLLRCEGRDHPILGHSAEGVVNQECSVVAEELKALEARLAKDSIINQILQGFQ